jgi:aspartate aminotransferase
MTGWRLGWSIAPKALSEAMDTVQGQVSSNASSVTQAAALAAIDGDQACVEEMRAKFEARRNLIVDGLSAIPGVRCFRPQGAFYAFPSFEGVIERGDPRAKDSLSLATYLLEAAKVATVPGSAFGAEGYLRLSYACSEGAIRDGIQRITRAISALRSG